MLLTRTRALAMCALLALPGGAFAQSSRSPTVFSPSYQMGTVNVRAAVVVEDYTVKPLPLLNVVARRTDKPDSVSGQTDLDGRLIMPLRVGAYTIRAKTAQPISGRSYRWSVHVVVRASRTEIVQLTNSNASSDSVAAKPTVVASVPVAPSPVSQPAPVQEKPAIVEKPAVDPFPLPPTKRAAPVDSAQPSVPAPERAVVAAPARRPATVRTAAPRTNTSNLLLGLSLNGSSIRADDLNASSESGAGLAGQLGWGFTKNFALVVDASAARIESLDGDFDLGHVDVSGRWHFVSKSHGLVPFLEVGYSGRAAMKQDVVLADEMGNTYTGDLKILGGGISAGAGLEYFIAQKWALGGSFKWTTGQFNRVQFDNVSVEGFELDATSARFNLGFSWYPIRGGR